MRGSGTREATSPKRKRIEGSGVYDAQGRRVRKTTSAGSTDYFYDLNNRVTGELNAGAWVAEYVYLGSRLIAQYKNATTYFIHSDHLGSTRLVTGLANPSTPVDSLDYLPFGQQMTGDTATSHKFTGKERDSESGLDNFGARYFGASTGRFMSADPVAGSAWNPQSLNAYSYVWNSPLKLTDPSGMIVSWEDSECKKKGNESECKTELQRRYERRIQDLLNSKDKKDQARGKALEATYDKLQAAKETFHVVREDGGGSGELSYRGHPGDLYVEMKGSGWLYGEMPDLQKLGHEFEHGEQFLNGLLGFTLNAKGKWVGYRDDLVDEANAFVAGFNAEPVGLDQSKFLQGLSQAANWGINEVVKKLDAPGSPYRGRSSEEVPITTITPSIYAVPRTQ